MLVADKQQAHVELACVGHAERIAVAAAHHQAGLRLGCARVREPDVAVERNHVTVRIFTVVRHVMLMLHAERRAGLLVAPEDRLLFFERRAVPELHVELDNTHGLIAAAHRPRGLALLRRYPYHAVH